MKQIADALELLTAQHEAITARLMQIATVDAPAQAQALGELADQITTHFAVEDQFLATLGMAPAANDELRVALADLLVMDMAAPDHTARIAAFTERWTGHVAGQDQTMINLAEVYPAQVFAELGPQLGALSEQSRCVAA